MQDKELHSVATNTEIASTLLGIEPNCALSFRYCSLRKTLVNSILLERTVHCGGMRNPSWFETKNPFLLRVLHAFTTALES